MSAVTVTIIKSGRTDPYGNPLVVGQSYSLDTDIAKSLLQAGYASVVDPVVFDDDSLSQGRVIATFLRFPGFKPSLLASLAASSTAERTRNVVTVSATGHGITTGTTYVGFRFYYPGSTNLTAGWYDGILTVPDANSLTFTATGPDFAAESINSGSAWTTITDMVSVTIPGGTLRDGSRLSIKCLRGGSSTGGIKATTLAFGGTNFATINLTTSPLSETSYSFRCIGLNSQRGVVVADNSASSIASSMTKNIASDQEVTVKGNLSVASEFLVLWGANVEILQ